MANRNIHVGIGAKTNVTSWNSSGAVLTNTNYNTLVRQDITTSNGYVGRFPTEKPLPVHSYTMNTQSAWFTWLLDNTNSSGIRTYGKGPFLSSSLAPIYTSPPIDYTNLRNEAIDKLGDHARGSLDLSVDLAEMHKTYKMVDAAERLEDLTRTFTRRFTVLKLAGNHWLEYVYGALPLVQTIFGCADELNRFVLNRLEKYSAKAKGKYQPDHVHLVSSVYGEHNENLVIADSDIDMVVRFGVVLLPQDFDLGRWSSLNPLSIAWELMPYSFVVDWVYNVGGYLRAMENSLLYAKRFVSGYQTNWSGGTLNVNIVNRQPPPGYTDYLNIIVGQANVAEMSRSALTSYPGPTLPSFDVKLGSSRLLSTAALLAQLLGRRPPQRAARLI